MKRLSWVEVVLVMLARAAGVFTTLPSSEELTLTRYFARNREGMIEYVSSDSF
jgi:hypothetical protein